METCVVLIDGSDWISQVHVLPSRYVHLGVEYTLIRQNIKDTSVKECRVVDGKLIPNYDLHLIPEVDCMAGEGDQINKITKTIKLSRYNKAHQTALLHENSQRLGSKGYMHIRTSSVDMKQSKPHVTLPGCDEDLGYMIKPVAGARSMGIMSAPAKCNIRAFLTELHLVAKPNIEEYSDKVYGIAEKFGVKITEGDAVHSGETIKTIFQNHLIVTERIDPKFKEYRVIISPNKQSLIFERNLKAGREEFATRLLHSEFENLYGETMVKEIFDLLHSLQLHGSVDLWINQDCRTWGVFEFQPQYCHLDIDDEVHVDFLKDTIHDLRNLVLTQN